MGAIGQNTHLASPFSCVENKGKSGFEPVAFTTDDIEHPIKFIRRAGWSQAFECGISGEKDSRLAISAHGEILWGDGESKDIGMRRVSNGILGLREGNSFMVNGTWDGGILKIGSWNIWDDGNRLRAKRGSAPLSKEDGIVIAETH